MEKIPCTIAILTKNSAATLAEALETVRNFSEIVICDGGSTDGTLTIAEQYGAKIIHQDKQFLDEEGKLIDFSGVRNQMLVAATYDWQFHLDSDELMTPELAEEILHIVSDKNYTGPFVYLVPRLYVYNGKRIERSINYPSYQYRFFNRAHVTQFTKKVHERIRFAETEVVGKLQKAQLVPVRRTAAAAWQEKFIKYIAMEVDHYSQAELAVRFEMIGILFKRIILLLVRLFTRRLCRLGDKLPLDYDLMPIYYQLSILGRMLRPRVLFAKRVEDSDI